MKDAKPLGDILAEYMKASKLTRRPKGGVSAAWGEVVGAQCAGHSRVAGVRQGCVHVVCDSSACLHEMANFRKAEILAALENRKGCEHIHDIKFRMGSLEQD